MRKRILGITVILLFGLTACGKGNEESLNDSSSESSSTVNTTESKVYVDQNSQLFIDTSDLLKITQNSNETKEMTIEQDGKKYQLIFVDVNAYDTSDNKIDLYYEEIE